MASAPVLATNTILRGIPNMLPYLDDILVMDSSKRDHLAKLEEVS